MKPPRYCFDETVPLTRDNRPTEHADGLQVEITALRNARHELLMLLVAVLWSNIQAHEDIDALRAERDAIAELLRQRDEQIAAFNRWENRK
jgi:hypothetical protein